MKGRTFIISGPSGVGKSTVLGELMKKRGNLYFSVSATTRAPRVGEQDGVHYHFLTRETYQEWVENGEFLEHADFVENSYGTPKRYVDEAMERGEDVILDIEVKGACQVKALRPDTVRIFLLPPSWEVLERRLRDRGTDAEDVIQKRLAQAKVDYRGAAEYDYFVVNDDLNKAVQELDAIFTVEHCRAAERYALLPLD